MDSDEQFQYNQVDNDIYFNNNLEPERDNRFRCYEYSIYLFYKDNIEPQFNLQFNWNSTGSWMLGDYHVVQYSGSGPLDSLYRNSDIIRGGMNLISSPDRFKIRYRYPELP